MTETWQRQDTWSRTATRLKSRIAKYRLAVLALTLCGAVLAAASTQLNIDAAGGDRPQLVAVGAAFSLGLIPALRVAFDRRMVSDWTRTRSIAEALKSEVYTFLAGVKPYRGPDREAVLDQHVRDVLRDAEDLTLYLPQTSPEPIAVPAVSDVASYVQLRLLDQIDGYYRPKAREMNHRLAVTRNIQAGLATFGAALGVLALIPGAHSAVWIGVVTTAGTAVAAYAAESRYQYQFIEYSRTVQQLNGILDGYLQAATQSPGPQGDDDLVSRCEQVISIQNQAWMVKWRNE